MNNLHLQLLFYSHYVFLLHKIKTSVLLFASFKYQSTTVWCVRCVCPRRQRFLSVWFLFVRSLFFFFKWWFKSLNCLRILSKKNNLKFCYINYNPVDSNSGETDSSLSGSETCCKFWARWEEHHRTMIVGTFHSLLWMQITVYLKMTLECTRHTLKI